MESNWVHQALRPLIGLLCQPRVITIMDKLVEWFAGKPKYSEKTCHSGALSTTNPTCCPDANPGRRDTTINMHHCQVFTSKWVIWTRDMKLFFFFLGLFNNNCQLYSSYAAGLRCMAASREWNGANRFSPISPSLGIRHTMITLPEQPGLRLEIRTGIVFIHHDFRSVEWC
jgi:hypothetical protein